MNHPTPGSNVAAGERAAFERAARKGLNVAISGFDFQRNDDDEYKWVATRRLYEFWKEAGRAALAGAPAEPPKPAVTRLDILSLIHSQCHRVYASAIDREEIDTKYMREIEDGLRDLAAAPSLPVAVQQPIGSLRRYGLSARSATIQPQENGPYYLAADVDAVRAIPAAERPSDTVEVPTITLTGHQIKEALDLISPIGPDGAHDPDEMDGDLTLGIVRHQGDDGVERTGMCCWNDDTDGVLPLDEYPESAVGSPSAARQDSVPATAGKQEAQHD